MAGRCISLRYGFVGIQPPAVLVSGKRGCLYSHRASLFLWATKLIFPYYEILLLYSPGNRREERKNVNLFLVGCCVSLMAHCPISAPYHISILSCLLHPYVAAYGTVFDFPQLVFFFLPPLAASVEKHQGPITTTQLLTLLAVWLPSV